MDKFDIENLMENVLKITPRGDYYNDASRVHYMDLVSVRHSPEFQEAIDEHPEYKELAYDIANY